MSTLLKRLQTRLVLSGALLLGSAQAAPLEQLHLFVPGPAGSGWDTKAYAVGDALLATGLAQQVVYDRWEGAGGWRGLQKFLADDSLKNALMVQSSPLIYRPLTGTYLKGFRELAPLVVLSNEAEAVVVASHSPYQNIQQLVAALNANPMRHPVILGASKGSIDHFAAAMILKKAGVTQPKNLRFTFRRSDEEAVQALQSGFEGIVLFTGLGGLGEALASGEVRLLAVSTAQRIPGFDAPTLREQGVDLVFNNWRGFFARADLPADQRQTYTRALLQLSQTAHWHATLARHGWSPLVLSGDELLRFLEEEESKFAAILQDIDLL
ncbi:Bug family tripartite tricarboxylate transporter substrate binding protein [Pseudomonas xionganensis]|uniref:Bug family tripartite tricarboxylate transporter substrate binding protein n=1 Tax=Pseudomonas xionganensis TaxID=2654845 RepID=UPI0013662381|nr:tripartite tricarboxylate transporter substrate-binding protein [Pseudomonas xionganensis]